MKTLTHLCVLLFLCHVVSAKNAPRVDSPYMDFTYDTLPCHTQSVTLKSAVVIPDGMTDNISKYEWRVFGRIVGRTARLPYRFDAGGNYDVTLVITTEKGYKGSITKKVSIKQEPLDDNWSVTINDDTFTKPDAHILTAKAMPAGAKAYFGGYYDPVDSITVTVPGYYIAYVKDACGNIRATDTVEIRNPDTSPWKFSIRGWYNDGCRTSATLKAFTNAPDSSYTITWNTGQTGDSLTVNSSNTYVATFKDKDGKTRRDTVKVTIEPMIIPVIRFRTAEGKDSLFATVVRKGYYYSWYRNDTLVASTPEGVNKLRVSVPGFYKVEMANYSVGCVVSSPVFEYNMAKDSIIPFLTISREDCNSLAANLSAKFYTSGISIDTVKSVTWSYGDGVSETLAPHVTAQHRYKAGGTYNVGYISTTVSGRQLRRSGVIVVNNIQYSLNITDDAATIPGVHILEAHVSSRGESITWNTGVLRDSIHVTAPGIYTATVRDTCNGTPYTASIEIKQNAVTDWQLNAYIGRISSCKDTAMLIAAAKGPAGAYSLEWSTGQHTDTIYVTNKGRYVVYLLDNQGNIRKKDTLDVNLVSKPAPSIEIHASPSADTLVAGPVNAGDHYKWYMEGVLQAGVNAPALNNPVKGNYEVEVINEIGCSNRSVPFEYKGWNQGTSFTYATDECIINLLRFTGTPVEGQQGVKYLWDFGDGSIGTYYITEHTFKPGTYRVTFTATTADSVKQSITKSITVKANVYDPVITVNTLPCGDQAYVSIKTKEPLWFFEWDGDPLYERMDDSIFVMEPGKFTVIGYDFCHNARVVDSIDVKLKPYFAPVYNKHYGAEDTLVIQPMYGGVEFSVDNPSPDVTFSWYIDDQLVREDHKPYWINPPIGRLQTRVTMTNGCTAKTEPWTFWEKADTLTQALAFTVERASCSDQMVTFHAPVVADETVTAYAWDFGDHNGDTKKDPVHVYKRGGTFNVIMRLFTASGKEKKVVQQVVIPDDPSWDLHIITELDSCMGLARLKINPPAAASRIVWSTGETTSQIIVRVKGADTVRVYDGCGNLRVLDTIKIRELPKFNFRISGGRWMDTLRVYEADAALLPMAASLPGYNFTWYKDDKVLPVKGSYILAPAPGVYKVEIEKEAGCKLLSEGYYVSGETVNFWDQDRTFESGIIEFGIRFKTIRNPENIYTVQLTLKDPGGRQTGMNPGDVTDLGSFQSDDFDLYASVFVPDNIRCSGNYALRVISSSPADTTGWSEPITLLTKVPKPEVIQNGDSLFTSDIFDTQWYRDGVAIPGAIMPYYLARQNGAYAVEYSNGTGCVNRSPAVPVVITAVGEVILGGNKVIAFPNPSEGKVFLKFEKPLLKQVAINVYNLQGNAVYSQTTSQQLQTLDLSTQPKGFYLIELTGYGTKKVLTLILQ
ncbi:PKD domain-containing protein [Chitinophaga filiformis]|uniref:Por secretion system C-terminal sorting domain-containing protein n=1 Tax=Chitinophaga filiformis TaxID=104663 RepID=A0A1G8BTV3_CHIFI|nr:PKD domain-containing protein [Chitinophaga filiformis]SDH36592.1 Por secretion system C-terminal sorting domain-containing protein [Chitinophaga filiformis]